MYVPQHFAERDLSTLHDFILGHSFALVCSAHDGQPFASHLPLLLDRKRGAQGVLRGHMARANPQWRQADGSVVLAVFSGPHAYVSPTWYEANDVVPTWNYVAVHVYGRLQLLESREDVFSIVRDMVTEYERLQPRPWTIGGSPEYVDRMLREIVGFEIEIMRIEGKWKLSQNHSNDRREEVAARLRDAGGEDALAIADLMERSVLEG
jgi:transcriptional regulator